ncbi:hypothetical protein GCM10017667_70190 [Streptomyces filamentosus]|uniref:Uncharacterized protein n=1 Tax=Streptomyces filamentosus TaxID=67294 RepID=A0A919ETE8_STRFL|nr:hypothetical protein GCM10017667_70190 [Streptomyces filamentosus]
MLHRLTGAPTWKTRSDDAFTFARSMISDDRNHLWTGTGPDGVTVDEKAVPEDVQVWSHLDAYDPEAPLDSPYARTVDWAADRMAATDGPFTGVSFSTVDTSGVWFEGTAHLLAACKARNSSGDAAAAKTLTDTLEKARAQAPTPAARASSPPRTTASTPDRATAPTPPCTPVPPWYLLAALGKNPLPALNPHPRPRFRREAGTGSSRGAGPFPEGDGLDGAGAGGFADQGPVLGLPAGEDGAEAVVVLGEDVRGEEGALPGPDADAGVDGEGGGGGIGWRRGGGGAHRAVSLLCAVGLARRGAGLTR